MTTLAEIATKDRPASASAETIDLAKIAEERGIKYFLISYIDLFGASRAKLVRLILEDVLFAFPDRYMHMTT